MNGAAYVDVWLCKIGNMYSDGPKFIQEYIFFIYIILMAVSSAADHFEIYNIYLCPYQKVIE